MKNGEMKKGIQNVEYRMLDVEENEEWKMRNEEWKSEYSYWTQVSNFKFQVREAVFCIHLQLMACSL